MNIEKKAVDWEWANKLPSLAICEAAALSLGYELDALDVLPPVGREYPGRPLIKVSEYGERAFLTYEYARSGKLKLIGTTSATKDIFDPKADFNDGQFWEIDSLEFRQFCDTIGWIVPEGFSPIGYKAVTASASDAETPKKTRAEQKIIQQDAYLETLRKLGGNVVKKDGKLRCHGIKMLMDKEASDGISVHDEQTYREYLKAAYARERESKARQHISRAGLPIVPGNFPAQIPALPLKTSTGNIPGLDKPIP